MSLGGRLFARLYDPMMSAIEHAGLGEVRCALLTAAKGSVVEIGAGTGANLACYGPGCDQLTLTEPEPAMIRHLQRRVRERAPGALLLRAPAEDLPFTDHSFDVAVSTLVLCTVDDPLRALRELRRVLRPGGILLFLEHVRADHTGLARWQDRLNGVNRLLGHGCNCNRPTLDLIRAAGFTVRDVSHDVMRKAPQLVRPIVIGTAEATAETTYEGHPHAQDV